MNFTEFLVMVGLAGGSLLIGTFVVTLLVPKARGEKAGYLLVASLCLIGGAVFAHSVAENWAEPDAPSYGGQYGEITDNYGGCSGGVRGC